MSGLPSDICHHRVYFRGNGTATDVTTLKLPFRTVDRYRIRRADIPGSYYTLPASTVSLVEGASGGPVSVQLPALNADGTTLALAFQTALNAATYNGLVYTCVIDAGTALMTITVASSTFELTFLADTPIALAMGFSGTTGDVATSTSTQLPQPGGDFNAFLLRSVDLAQITQYNGIEVSGGLANIVGRVPRLTGPFGTINYEDVERDAGVSGFETRRQPLQRLAFELIRPDTNAVVPLNGMSMSLEIDLWGQR